MDTKNYLPEKAASLRQSLIIKNVVRILIVAAVAYAVYALFFKQSTELTPENSYQTTPISDEQRKLLENSEIPGYIQLTRVDAVGTTTNVEIINYHPASETYTVGADDGRHFNFYPTSSSTGAVLRVDDETGQFFATTFDFVNDLYEPLPLEEGQTTNSVYPSVDNVGYIMNTYPSSLSGTPDLADIDNWRIRFYNSKTSNSFNFTQATSPQWFNYEHDIIFLKKNGIFRYSIESETGIANNIFNKYSNISGWARVAVSDKSKYMILTLPSAKTISVLRFDDVENSIVREVRRITSSNTWYRSPVFSPDGMKFAVIAVDNSEADNTSKNTLVIYSVLNNEPIYTRDLGNVLHGHLSLTDWQMYEVIAPYSADEDESVNDL